ncbi:MAG: hypothetical protein JSR33_13340 [Proteobacteria bacterium]|nr:hypothetical protein [Pseudomonadota bacterium]
MKKKTQQLFLEIENKDWRAVSELIVQGADPYFLNSEGLNAFDTLLNSAGYAEAYQKISQEKILSKGKANIQNELDALLRAFAKKEVYLSSSIFGEATNRPFNWPYFSIYVQKLYQAGANPHAVDEFGHSTFSISARNLSSCFDLKTQSHQRFFLLMFKTLYNENVNGAKVSIGKWSTFFAKSPEITSKKIRGRNEEESGAAQKKELYVNRNS